MLNRMFAVLGVVVSTASLVGCVDPRGAFDDFNERTGTTDASTVDRPASAIFPISGDFLLTVRAGFEPSNDPAYYIQFLANFDLTVTGDTGSVDVSLMPLCTCSTCPMRTSVPPAFVGPDMPVAADGTFEAMVNGQLLGNANPFSCGDQPMNATMQASIISADLICGSVTGVAAGIDLAGSTFAAIRVTDTDPANLPAPVAACPGSQPIDAGS